MRISLTYIIILLVLAGCAKRNISSNTSIKPEEYEVYSSVIELLEPSSIPSNYKDRILFVRDSSIIPYSLVGYYDTSQASFSKRPTIADSEKPIPVKRFESIDVFGLLEQVFSEYDWKFIRNSFDVSNKSIDRLDSAKISWPSPGCLVSNQEFHSILIADTTSVIFRTYRDSITCSNGFSRLRMVQLSRVGFDLSNSLAIVFYNSGRPGGGNYGFFVLKKESSKWISVKRLWIGYM